MPRGGRYANLRPPAERWPAASLPDATAMQRLVFFLALSLSLLACDASGPDSPGEPSGPSGDAGAYVAQGRVTDAQGRPMAGVAVVASHTVYHASYVTGRTGADGRYRLEVPDGSWVVYATTEPEYHGRQYRFDLAPHNPDAFAGREGAVRDFTWRLSGVAPASYGWRWYGGTVTVQGEPGADLYNPEHFLLRFTPEGPRVDGSAGEPFEARPGAAGDAQYGASLADLIVDVPIGRYTVTAQYAPPGQTPRPLLLRNLGGGSDAYAPSVTFDFEPELYGIRNHAKLWARLG